MTQIRPLDAALEGLRIIRHKPGLVLAWTGFYLLSALGLIGVLLVGLGPKVMTLAPVAQGGERDLDQLFARFGLSAVVAFLAAIILTTMLAGAVYRSILRPEEKQHSYLQIGGDELRLLILSLVVVFAVAAISAVYGGVVFGLANRLSGFAYGLVTFLASVGGVVLTLWLAVRLSLSAAMTFSQRKVRLWQAWKLTRGHAPRLLAMWGLTVVFVFVVTIVAATLSWVVAGVLGFFTTLAQIDPGNLSHLSPGVALAVLGQLLIQLAIQVLVLVLLLVVAYAPPARAYLQLKDQA
ncbi:hypothetical protein [Caulobacter mirabilis]|uniref:Glycerophosphoryl diester phosphodiesterase membrane domain-containing protein n=1 Tax=Caulobacter mirabilis TaxID=69666 RepID=A0A2D2AWV1_9CAUL|nr:hypothetical protein [Caulobacter mirabilis]ATQ42482.1 hypothetical protein CSW64_08670 [Caulobacter mirabilis]